MRKKRLGRKRSTSRHDQWAIYQLEQLANEPKSFLPFLPCPIEESKSMAMAEGVQGDSPRLIARVLGVSERTVYSVFKKFQDEAKAQERKDRENFVLNDEVKK